MRELMNQAMIKQKDVADAQYEIGVAGVLLLIPLEIMPRVRAHSSRNSDLCLFPIRGRGEGRASDGWQSLSRN
jgi:hypothetical protein